MSTQTLYAALVRREREQRANAAAIKRAAMRGDRAVCKLAIALEERQSSAFWNAVRRVEGKVA